MIDKHCAICNKTRDLFLLRLNDPDYPDETWTKDVCGSCWDIIATIARRIAKDEIRKDKENEPR